MRTRRTGERDATTEAPRSGAFDPWAPRGPQAGPVTRPANAAPVTPFAEHPPSPPTFPPAAPLAGAPNDWIGRPTPPKAPVHDDQRPTGAPPTPPVSWPSPRVAGAAPEPPSRRRGGALWVFVAFLAGALLVGAAFGSYALGVRNAEDGGSVEAADTSRPRRADPNLDIQAILDVARPSVVTIEAGASGSMFGGAGSGVVYSEDGLIITNAHVIAGAGNEIAVRFSDGTTAAAELVGASTPDDIALIKVDRTDLTPAALGSSANLLVGDPVVAIGNALNLGGDPSVTSGIVSAKDRDISDGNVTLENLIQTDAAINPGNSGGALVNSAGEVVGINTAIIQGAQNIGFAIAIDNVKLLIEDLLAGGGDLTANTAVLGVSTLDVSSPDLADDVREEFDITADAGAVVVNVDPESAAGAAGLQVGDVIVEFDGEAVRNAEQLTRLVRGRESGDEVSVVVVRRGERTTVSVTLGP
jgi:putative serine protease PepD